MKAADSFFEAIVTAAVEEAERRLLERINLLPTADRTLNAQEAADYLGISRKTLYVLCAEKQIMHIPAGSIRSKKPIFLFRQSTLDEWLRQKERESVVMER